MTPRTALLVLSLLLPFTVQAAAQTAYNYRGTVHAVNTRARTLELITGVGMALRIVKITAPSAASLANLKVGDVVSADCHRAATGLVADRIEKVEVATP